MSPSSKLLQERSSALELIEEAGHLLRRLPGGAWLTYLAAVTPFLLGFLFFWAEMTHSAYAYQNVGVWSLVLALLFCWMKTGQWLFGRQLRTRLGAEVREWRLRDLPRLSAILLFIHVTGLFLLPIALVLAVPFPWLYAYYHNATLLDWKPGVGLRQYSARAYDQAMLWPGQNHLVLMIVGLFALTVWLNLLLSIINLPDLVRTFTGIETEFSMSLAALLNTTTLAATTVLTYLIIDPLMRAIYAIRCFHGQSLATGEDLLADLGTLRPLARRAAIFALFLLAAFGGTAQEESTAPAAPSRIDSAELNQRIDEILEQRRFSWRMPRERIQPAEDEEKGVIGLFLESLAESIENAARTVGRWLKDMIEWVMERLEPDEPEIDRDRGRDWFGGGRAMANLLMWSLLGVVLVALAIFIVRLWRQRPPLEAAPAEDAIALKPDLEDESITADDRPLDEWMALAREMMERGERRLAVRALMLASLAALGRRQLVAIARYKSNRDYVRELDRRSHVFPDVIAVFGEQVRLFDQVWYGRRPADESLAERFNELTERIREDGGPA